MLPVRRVVGGGHLVTRGRHGRARAPRVRRDVVDQGRVVEDDRIRSARRSTEDVDLVRRRVVDRGGDQRRLWHRSQRRPRVRDRVVAVEGVQRRANGLREVVAAEGVDVGAVGRRCRPEQGLRQRRDVHPLPRWRRRWWRRRWWRRRWRRWRRRRRRWWPAGRDLVVEDVLLGDAADRHATVDPRRVDRPARTEGTVVVARVARLDVRVGLRRHRVGDVADRSRRLPGGAVVGREATEALQVVARRVALVVPADEDLACRSDRKRGLPLPTRPTVAVQPERSAPGDAVVGRAHVVDVALVAPRPVLRIRVVDDVVRADADVAPAHVPPVLRDTC